MTRHIITMTVTVEMEIEPEVIERAMTDAWQGLFYQMDRVEDVFEMLAWNIGVQQIGLSHLDGWADLPDSAAVVQYLDYQVDEVTS